MGRQEQISPIVCHRQDLLILPRLVIVFSLRCFFYYFCSLSFLFSILGHLILFYFSWHCISATAGLVCIKALSACVVPLTRHAQQGLKQTSPPLPTNAIQISSNTLTKSSSTMAVFPSRTYAAFVLFLSHICLLLWETRTEVVGYACK